MSKQERNLFKKSELTTILVVTDLERAKSFYKDVLGAKIYRDYGGDSVVLRFLENWILHVTSGEPTEDKPGVFFEPMKNVNSVNHAFTIRVEDCNYTYEELLSRGAQFITPPYQRGTETRCFFRDPDGHLFEISEYNG